MGQEIGFNIYKKDELEKNKRLVEVEGVDLPFVCGRTDSTNSWGELFSFTKEKTITPVFQKELDGFEDDYSTYKLVDFEDFKKCVLDVVKKDLDDSFKDKCAIYKHINEMKEEIGELRELQRDCTEDQSYAFNRWEEAISTLKDSIRESEEYVKDFDTEDYTGSHAKYTKDLLMSMEKYLEKDEYLVIPFYSF